jgi:methyltransferase (TIGR00027 family)
MQPRVRSRTAEATAAIRACHYAHASEHLFADPYAQYLTSPGWRTVCSSPVLYRLVIRGLLRGLQPVHGWILVRDKVAEETLLKFAEVGMCQFVLLGAGFDSTALRRPAGLEGVRIFEVDHPATQAAKLERIASLGKEASACSFEAVAIDFERESLADGLARSSFDPRCPTLFARSGVIYYLSAPAIRQTLNDISALSAPGSELMTSAPQSTAI